MSTIAHILCVAHDHPLGESKCKVLESAGYDTTQASPQLAIIILASQKFDLVVISSASEVEMNRILNVSGGAEILILMESTNPSELLSRVAERLKRRRGRRA